MTYQKINLTTRETVGPMGLPKDLKGLAVASLADLSEALNPCPDDYVGMGFLPVGQADDVPDGKVSEGQTVVMLDDAPVFIHTLRDKTADELAAELQANHEAAPNLSRAQFAMAVAGAGVITTAEALGWIKGDDLPALAAQAIAELPAAERPFAEIKFYAADQIARSSDLVELLRTKASLSHAQLDGLFEAGAAL